MKPREVDLLMALPRILEISMETALRLINDQNRMGGYFCLSKSDGTILAVFRVGEPDSAKTAKYIEFCQEKAARLAAYHQADENQVSSFQSRDPSENKYAGAVMVGNYILSFSGLPEL